MPAPAFFYRRPVTREESLDFQQCEAFERSGEFRPAPAREIIAPECAIGKYRIAADEDTLFFAVQADAPRCVPGRMDDDKIPDCVSFFQHQVRHDPGRTGAKVHREVLHFVKQAPGIVLVDGNFGLAHVRDLFDAGGMVEMAVGEDDGLDPLLVRGYCHRQDARVHEDISHDIGVCPDISGCHPLDLHAQ